MGRGQDEVYVDGKSNLSLFLMQPQLHQSQPPLKGLTRTGVRASPVELR